MRSATERSGRGWKTLALILLVLLVFSGLGNIRHWVGSLLGGGRSVPGGQGRLEETMVEDNGADDNIAVVDVEGIIMGSLLSPGDHNLVDSISDQLKRAGREASVKAVILRVNSPGGEVLASDEISKTIEDFQKSTGKPVVAAMGALAASGGYYVSAPCALIVAHELTLTGSIGVIMHGYNYRGLMDKVGLRPNVFKSGKFKDMMSPDKRQEDETQEERSMIQNLVDEAFARFKRVVGEGRERAATMHPGIGRKLAPDWQDYADGRVLSGRQARDLGLVDELGSFRTAFELTKKLVRVQKANLIRYQQPFELSSLFRLLGQEESSSRAVKLDLGIQVPRVEAGRLYYLFEPGVR